jgi:hypothetical protein
MTRKGAMTREKRRSRWQGEGHAFAVSTLSFPGLSVVI